MTIIDFHAHIFSRVDGCNDRGPVKSAGLGRVSNGGEVRPFIPPYGPDTTFPLECLDELMTQNGVSRAMLLQGPTIGNVNEEVARAIKDKPERFSGVMQVDPFAPDAAEQIGALAAKAPYAALKLEMSEDWGWLGVHPADAFSYTQLYPLVEAAAGCGLSIILDTGNWTGKAYAPKAVGEMARTFPQTRFVVEHLGYFMPGTPRPLWEEMIEQGKLENIWFGLSAVGQLLAEEYPCAEALALVAWAHRSLGAQKLLWGSDIPTTLMRYTYQQEIDMVLKHAVFLSDREKEQVMGENAMQFFPA